MPLLSQVLLVIFLSISVSLSALADKKPADVRLLIDISGSMKLNDPNNLRRPAVDLLIQLLPPNSKAGVWAFGQEVNMLVKHQQVDDEWRNSAKRAVDKINSTGLYTNIGGVLSGSLYDLEFRDDSYDTSLILLTDGMVDISKQPEENRQAREQILSEILSQAKAAGIRIHTVALSENADTRLMEQLAIQTGGLYAVANNADELMAIFLRAFDEAAAPEQVALTDNRFVVDSSVEEFTALIFTEQGDELKIKGPDGTVYEPKADDRDARWHIDARYALVTIKQPHEGEWLLLAPEGALNSGEDRVNIVSDLSLRASRLAKLIEPGSTQSIEVELQSEGKALALSEFNDVTDIQIRVRHIESGKAWRKSLTRNKAEKQTEFVAKLTMLKRPGEYEVEVFADGKTFSRSHKQRVRVAAAFELSHKAASKDGVDGIEVLIYGRGVASSGAQYSVELSLSYLDNDSAISVPYIQQGEWQLFVPTEQAASYRLSAVVTQQSKLVAELGPQVFHYEVEPPVETKPAVSEPIAEPEPEVEPEPLASQTDDELAEDTMAADDEGSMSILLIIGLAFANLALVAVAYIVYRKLSSTDPASELDEDLVSSLDAEFDESDEVLAAPQTAAGAVAEVDEPAIVDDDKTTIAPAPEDAFADMLDDAAADDDDDSGLDSIIDIGDKKD